MEGIEFAVGRGKWYAGGVGGGIGVVAVAMVL